MKKPHSIFLFLLLCLTYVYAEDIDPQDPAFKKQVCDSKNYNCGFIPLDEQQERAVEKDSVNFIKHRGLPSSADLSGKFPNPGSQGQQGSCVGWSSTYGIMSYLEKIRNNWDFGAHVQNENGKGDHIFSPAWTYNQINRGKDQGSVPTEALELLKTSGAAPWSEMPYSDKDYRKQPTEKIKKTAANYKIDSYTYLNQNDPNAMKAVLAAGHPILAGIKVYDNFYKLGDGQS